MKNTDIKRPPMFSFIQTRPPSSMPPLAPIQEIDDEAGYDDQDGDNDIIESDSQRLKRYGWG